MTTTPTLIRDMVTDAQRKQLRKMKTPPTDVKVVVYGGNKAGPMMASQFNQDVQTYGLWEALLYVENYERQGQYIEGTAAQAIRLLTNGSSKI